MQEVFQSKSTELFERDKLKKILRSLARWSGQHLRTIGFTLSGPAAFSISLIEIVGALALLSRH